MPAPTVAFELYDAVFNYLQHSGFSEDAICEQLGVRSRVDFCVHDRVPLSLYEHVFIVAEELTADPIVGMRVGAAPYPSHVGVFHDLTLAAESVTRILVVMSKYFPLAYDFLHLETTQEGEGIQMLLHYQYDQRPHRHVVEYLMAHWYRIAELLSFDEEKVPRVIHLKNSPAASKTDLAEIFHTTPVLFNEPEDRFDLRQESLGYHSGEMDPEWFIQSEIRASQLLVRLRANDRIAREISHHVLTMLDHGLPDLESVASRMRCSGRTLQRRLAERNLTFQMLLDSIRKDRAIDLLAKTRLPIAQIAERTGFADDSTFHRAFKRWTGRSPGAFRQ